MSEDIEELLKLLERFNAWLTPWQKQVLREIYENTEDWCPRCAGDLGQKHARPAH